VDEVDGMTNDGNDALLLLEMVEAAVVETHRGPLVDE